MSPEQVLLVFEDSALLDVIARALLVPADFQVHTTRDPGNLAQKMRQLQPGIVILEMDLAGETLETVRVLLDIDPTARVLLFAYELTLETSIAAMQAGVTDILLSPIKIYQLLQSIQRAREQRAALHNWNKRAARRNTQSLQRRLDELDALARVGRSVTASLDVDNILTTAVESAVDLTAAEEGSLMLLDKETGELYVRAAKNRGNEPAQTLRQPAQDALASEVIRNGEPQLYASEDPQKPETADFVHSRMYVPLRAHSGVMGVLGVQNRGKKETFSENQLAVVAAIADYAAIAIENARLYSDTEIERRKLNTILTKIVDGVIVVDHDRKVILVNPTAREAFSISSQLLTGRSIYDAAREPELLKIFRLRDSHFPLRREIVLADGRVFNLQATAIPEVGLALTMQDITQIKELDRVKSEFVSAVSHDLRSPLTAILGYVELLERVGTLNATQKEFVQRVHISVQNITNLINELLDLGRIEAGFDARREFFSLEKLVLLTIDEHRELADAKSQAVMVELDPNLPDLFASPTRIQQVLSNLIGNAIKYTQPNGWVRISAQAEDDHLILQVQDNGPGILVSEQPYIFDRFYRASNIEDTSGTGLGLAIVKSIVENHQGRIWVDSLPGKGATFTVMLPLVPGLENIQKTRVDIHSTSPD